MADSTSTVGSLSAARSFGGTAVVGSSVYVLGGFNTAGTETSTIQEYEPAVDSASTLSAALPRSLAGAAAATDGRFVYLFGGVNGWTFYRYIHRYDTQTGNVKTMSTLLPSARAYASAIYDGSNFYVFGGWSMSVSNPPGDEIVKYNPATETVTTVSTSLPNLPFAASVAWSGSHAYLFGGYAGDLSAFLNQIVKYTPSTNTLTTLSATLPSVRGYTSATWADGVAYVFGGRAGTGNPDPGRQIVRYDPAGGATQMSALLPAARIATGAAWDGNDAYVLGGQNTAGTVFGDVYRYNVAPGRPNSPQATSGPADGQITVTWSPPNANTFSTAITQYKVWRKATTGGETLAGTSSTTSFVDSGLDMTKTYTYRVTAVNPYGEGPFSLTACGRPAPWVDVPDSVVCVA